jgi:3-phenylpropionate/trans-cinnamate dioxygenase ferredoxin reductase subunit
VRAASTLRERGFTGRVVLAGAEDGAPYQRPPLSKEQLADPAAASPLRAGTFWARRGIELLTGDPVVDLGTGPNQARLRSGRAVPWDRAVLATGARARPLSVPGGERALVLRTTADAARLRARLTGGGRSVVVVGGGLLGLEVAAVARTLGHHVTVVEVADRLLGRVASAPTADRVAALHRGHGVVVRLRRTVAAVHDDGTRSVVELDDGCRVPADVVVAAVGTVPETGLAAAAGIATGSTGVLVDEHLRTSDTRVSAVGDCAAVLVPATGARVRTESVQTAEDQGRYTALDVLGAAGGPYAEVPWGWSRQYGTVLQTAGTAAGHDRTVLVGDPGAGPCSVLCFAGDRLCGVESVDAPGDHVAARRLLVAGGGPTPDEAARPGFMLARRAA